MKKIMILAALLLPAAAAAQMDTHNVHYRLIAQPESVPKKIVVLAPDITVRELTAGGISEKVPEWTQQASEAVLAALNKTAGGRQDFALVTAPKLSEEEEALLDEYLATYMVVGLTAKHLSMMGGEPWEHKRKHFDYTLGGGLDFLREKTGADAAIITVGEDFVSSAGRKFAFIAFAALGVAIPMGYSVLFVGVVDLRTGDILWLHHDASGVSDLKDPVAVQSMIDVIMQKYPGIEAKKTAMQ